MHDKAFNFAKNPKCHGSWGLEVLLQWFINSLIKKLSGIEMENMSDQQLAEELNKLIIGTFKKRKVESPFIDNIWGEY